LGFSFILCIAGSRIIKTDVGRTLVFFSPDFLLDTTLVIALVLCTHTLEIISVFLPREGRNILKILFTPKIFPERELDGKMATPYCINSMRNFCSI
jgi:hypothetical protein